MKRIPLSPALLLVLSAGCLPPFDNHLALSDQDMAGPADMGPDPCAVANDANKKIAGNFTLIDETTTPYGGRLYIEGCENATPPVGSSTNDLTKKGLSVVIPKAFYDTAALKHLVIDGMYKSDKSSGTLQPIWFAPRVKIDGGIRTASTFFHGVMGTMRDRLASELLAAGKISATDAGPSFATKFTYAYGWLALYDGFQINNVKQTTFSLDSTANPGGNADASSCSLMNNDNNCCLYYSDSTFDDAFVMNKPLLNFSGTKSTSAFFAIVCRDDGLGAEKPEITVTQTATAITDNTGSPVDPSFFPPFQVPRKRNAHVIIDNWHTFQ